MYCAAHSECCCFLMLFDAEVGFGEGMGKRSVAACHVLLVFGADLQQRTDRWYLQKNYHHMIRLLLHVQVPLWCCCFARASYWQQLQHEMRVVLGPEVFFKKQASSSGTTSRVHTCAVILLDRFAG